MAKLGLRQNSGFSQKIKKMGDISKEVAKTIKPAKKYTVQNIYI
jgi:hypothetical protein